MSLAGDLLPSNATAFEKALAASDDRILEIDADIVRRVTRPDECPPDQLHILAWEYSVDEWEPTWSDLRKRGVIKASFEVHRFKGTAYALEKAISAIGQGVLVEEWFEYGGHPYRFRLVVDLDPEEVFSSTELDQIIRVALRTKNVRSLLEYVLFRRTRTSPFYVAAAVTARVTQTIGPFIADFISLRPYVYAGVSVSGQATTTLYPGA